MGQKKQRLWTRGFVLLLIVSLTENLSFLSIRTMMTTYAKNDLMIASSLVGFLTGAISIASLFSRPIAGKLLKRFSHKKILLAALAGELLVLAAYLGLHSFGAVLVIRICHGFFYGISYTTIITMAGNAVPPEHMGSGMGVFGFGNMIGLGVAPQLSLMIYEKLGVQALFLSSCLFTACSIALVCFFPKTEAPVRRKASQGERRGLRSLFLPSALPSSFLNFFLQITYGSISAFIIVYGQSRNWAQVGLFYTVYAAGSLIVRPAMGKVYDRFGLTPVVLFTTCVFAGGIVLLALTTSFALFLVSAILLTIGYGGGWSVYQADALKCDDPADRGTASATYFVINDAGGFIGATLAGYVVDLVGYSNTFLSYIGWLALSFLIYFIRLGLRRSRQAARHAGHAA